MKIKYYLCRAKSESAPMSNKDGRNFKNNYTMTPRILNDSIIGVLSKIPSNDLILPALQRSNSPSRGSQSL